MTKVLAFKTKTTARDEESLKLRWHCELQGLAVIQDFGPSWAKEQFKTRFGVLPDESAYTTPTHPSAAVRFWGMEQYTLALEKAGDHKTAARAREARDAALADKDVLARMDWLSDNDWNWFCSRPVPVTCGMPDKRAQA